MKSGSLSTFPKLYGLINTDVDIGDWTLKVKNGNFLAYNQNSQEPNRMGRHKESYLFYRWDSRGQKNNARGTVCNPRVFFDSYGGCLPYASYYSKASRRELEKDINGYK
jgi:hypothetical protein